jgi:hypothetical protein
MTTIYTTSEGVAVIERQEPIGDSTWLGTRQAAIYASLGAATIRKACGRHELQHVRVGRANGPILIRTEWVDAWIMREVRGPAVD